MPGYLDDIRRAAKDIRSHTHSTARGQAKAKRWAELLDQAADREDEYLAGEEQPNPPQPGEESWLAWQIARAWLGEDGG